MRNGGESSAALSRSIVFMILRATQAGGVRIKRNIPVREAPEWERRADPNSLAGRRRVSPVIFVTVWPEVFQRIGGSSGRP